MSLGRYRKKRNPALTPEPRGKKAATRHQNRIFVVQKHAARHLHYDVRLELNGVLLSWAVPKGPSTDPGIKRLAVHVEDHPLDYATFEGVIPQGQYGAGKVKIWDKGEWIPEDDSPVAAYKKGDMSFTLKGKKLKGRWKLIRINRNDKTWLMIKANDKRASIVSKEKEESTSPLKKINFHLDPSPFPDKVSPELGTLVDQPPAGKNWLHEIKFDGYRLLAFKQGNKTRLITRHGHNWAHKFKSITAIINKLDIPDVILDGEIVMLDEHQRSDFQLLQNAIKDPQGNPFIYYVFDVLYYDRYNLMSLPLLQRKKILKTLFTSIRDEHVRFSDHIVGSGREVFKKSCELGLEGIVSKEMTAPYTQRRTKDWLKSKCVKRQEFVIGGFTSPRGSRSKFGSLLIGTFNKQHELVYNGRVGTGFSEATLKSIHKQLSPLITDKQPFHRRPPITKNTHWVKPVLVAEVEYTEKTRDNVLRHPSFKGLRVDKPARDIHLDTETAVTSLNTDKLSHPDKILYKEGNITKLKLLEYYEAVAEWILPFIDNRPLSLVRCPEDYKKCFFQKHIEKLKSGALHATRNHDLYINDEAGLFLLPQLNVLEIHPWGCKIDQLDYPDTLVFDLDPAPGLAWKKIVAAAFALKTQLSSMNLKSFVKTTGGAGLHVVVPIVPHETWAEVKNLTQVVAEFIRLNDPERYTVTMNKRARQGKIFIDYLRNQKGATAIAPYSTRALIHAPVATPLHWDELTNDKRDTTFTLKTIPARLQSLKTDPWKDYFTLKQSLHLKQLLKTQDPIHPQRKTSK